MNATDFIITSTYQEIAGRLVYLHPVLPFITKVNPPLRGDSFDTDTTSFGFFISTAKIGQDNTRVMLHLQCQGFAG